MKRSNAGSTYFFCLLSFVDLILTSIYLSKDASGLEIADEVVSLLPDVLSPIRLAGPKGIAALVALDVTAFAVNLGIGIKLNNDTLAELRAGTA